MLQWRLVEPVSTDVARWRLDRVVSPGGAESGARAVALDETGRLLAFARGPQLRIEPLRTP